MDSASLRARRQRDNPRDQIRKRNVYCRRRTQLSSFSEIIRLGKGQEKEGSFVWRTSSVFPRAPDGEYVWPWD